jgi:hypothetical protein
MAMKVEHYEVESSSYSKQLPKGKRIEVTSDAHGNMSGALVKALQQLLGVSYQEASNMEANTKFKKV